MQQHIVPEPGDFLLSEPVPTPIRQSQGGAAGAIEIRRLAGHAELARAFATFRNAMVGLPSLGTIDGAALDRLYEPGRTYGAYAGDALVGTTDSYSGEIAVPGGTWLSHAAVTHVGVLPTHTRRGVASALFSRQLRDLREEGVAIATLRASDARIYGHFGYGIASTSAAYEIDTEGALSRMPPPDGVRLIEARDAWPVLKRIYAKQAAPRPGTITRSRYWWDMQALRLERSDAPAYVAVTGGEDAETGFVRYHPTGLDSWFTSQRRTVVVSDVVAHDAAAYQGLISHLLAVDLHHRLNFPMRPVDDALPWLFENFRSVAPAGMRDETWLRLIDVGRALSARSYGHGEAVVLGISDPILPDNNGNWHLSPDGAKRTDAKADASVDISALSAAYLGGAKWWQLAMAGQVVAGDQDALAALDNLFATAQAPFSGTMF